MSANRTNSDQFQLRLPPGLRDRIKAAADRRGRSANAEIVATLEEAYPDPLELASELRFMDEIDELAKKLERIRAGLLAEEIAKGRQEVTKVRQEEEDLGRIIDKADDLLKPKK